MLRSVIFFVRPISQFLVFTLLIFQYAVVDSAYAVVIPTDPEIAKFKAAYGRLTKPEHVSRIKALIESGGVQYEGYRLISKLKGTDQSEVIKQENEDILEYIEFIAKYSNPPSDVADVARNVIKAWGMEEPSGTVKNPDLFAVIEVGGKGVKGLLVNFNEIDKSEQCQRSEVDMVGCLFNRDTMIEPYNVNAIDKTAFDEVARSVREMIEAMISAKARAVDINNIYIVGSSSVGKMPEEDKADLKKRIEKEIGWARKMEFIKSNDEARLNAEGILNIIIPNGVGGRNRADKKKKVIVLDVGSGGIVGSYYLASEQDRIETFSYPLGVKRYAEFVENSLQQSNGDPNGGSMKNDADFQVRSNQIMETKLEPEFAEIAERKPGMKSRSRVYLIGGINWALTNFMHSGDRRRFPEINPINIKKLRKLAVDGEMDIICRDTSNLEIKKSCDTFTTRQVIAGMDILRAFAKVMDFEKKDKIFFIRDALLVWSLGYLKEKCMMDDKC
ncbi:hypothetical protein SAMN02949497_0899 [Methylomagnum ishizawai]|uniref:Ppx/GppA phosphatase family protein n=1 Tax=Methylomagnum ishizawai TaxID=1760988 RepID=A0A1Y6CZ77_9GAMM|nr:hypothetical protein [Methylomagnum ishizawai]SMF93612.1 hypothetical protein SAMN02949497_0899 [Methylomagnum ishizawai]